MTSNPGYFHDNVAPQLNGYQNLGNDGRLAVGGDGSGGTSRDSIIYNRAVLQGPSDLVWMRPRTRVIQEEDDPCDYGVEHDPMDEMERDIEDEDGEAGYSCCAETRYNCGRFAEVLDEEAYLLKRSLHKIDVKKYSKKIFSLEKVKGLFPILEWAPKYRTAELQGDIVAGITVGMTLVPQSIAYANIATLPAQYGLYASILGPFIYVIFGTSKDAALGPTAVMGILTAHYGTPIVKGDHTVATLLGLFTGVIQLIMFTLGIGALIDLISFPVMKAFTVACSITILLTQIKHWLGEKVMHGEHLPEEFIPQLVWTLRKVPTARLYDFLLGVVSIFFIFLFRKLKEIKWKRKLRELPWKLKIVKKGLWFIGTGRNIIVLALASMVANICYRYGICPFTLTGFIPPGIPSFRAPNLTFHDKSTNVTLTLSDLVSRMGVGWIVVPVLGLIESMSIIKVYARKFNYKPRANQELLPYAIANILGAFIQGYPVCASFSRTSVNGVSGVKTPAAGIIVGSIVLIALQFLTPMFFYIPEATLACVIIMAVIEHITFHKVWIVWKTKKCDLLPWIVTFVLSFAVGIEWGVLIGAALSLLMLLYPVMRPTIKIYEPGDEIDREKMKVMVVTIDTGLMYPAVEYIKKKIFNYCMKVSSAKYVVLDFTHVHVIDTTTIQGVRELLEDFHEKGIKVFICGMQKGVAKIFRRASPRFFNQAPTVSDAVDIVTSTNNTLQNTCSSGTPPVTVKLQCQMEEDQIIADMRRFQLSGFGQLV